MARFVRCSAASGIIALILVFQSLGFQACAADDWHVPVPVLPKDAPIPLRVAMIESDRFDTFSPAEWSQLLGVTARTMKAHFDLDVTFSQPDTLDMGKLFRRLDRALTDDHKAQIADLRRGNIDWDKITEAIRATLPDHQEGLTAATDNVFKNLDGLSAYPEMGLIEEQQQNLAEILSDALARKIAVFQTRAGASLFDYPDRKGKPGYNEWVYWDALPSLDLPYDVYLTNQPVISVEYFYYPLHAVLRGGITVGTTSAGTLSLYGTGAWISVFSFLDTSVEIQALRGGESYSRTDAIDLAGKYLAHELGHLLLHLHHPWENTACVMRPAEVLRFAEWAERLDPAACQIGSSPDMEIGSGKIAKPYFKE